MRQSRGKKDKKRKKIYRLNNEMKKDCKHI